MYFKKPIIESGIDDIKFLAPIPIYQHQFDEDDFHKKVYDFGYDKLTDAQKLMGQELPGRFDTERQDNFQVWYDREDEWVEENEFQPIGSRFWTPPNDFLNIDDNVDVKIIKDRIENGYLYLLESIGYKHNSTPLITESWMQYYDPYSGRGHNAHNHCRWSPEEAKPMMFSGGYYLSDGLPIKDHPYSGVFAFHIRGMKYYIRPKKGMLIIWPYDIVHSVEPFYGSENRCVINFNIQLK
jgi:hypothetical protein